MNILDLSQRYLLNATELRVLEYILNAVEQGEPKINIRTVAKESFVSTTVVVNPFAVRPLRTNEAIRSSSSTMSTRLTRAPFRWFCRPG